MHLNSDAHAQVAFQSSVPLRLQRQKLTQSCYVSRRNHICTCAKGLVEWVYPLTFISSFFQNYLLGKKETAEMADRNKEVLLEVCLFTACSLFFLHILILKL